MAVNGTDLYVGGFFTQSGDSSGRCLAKWDGTNWSAVGSGVDYTIQQMEADKAGHLFIRGAFAFGGTNSSPQIVQANIGLNILGGTFQDVSFSPLTGFSSTFSDATIGQPYRIQTAPAGAVGAWTDFTNFTYTGPIAVSDPAANATTNRLFRASTP
jgi:hypothetical protein